MNYFIHMLLYFLRLEEYFSVIICTFYIIDCVQGLEFFHCNFYIIGLEKNHFGPNSILLCTNRKWGFLQWCLSFDTRKHVKEEKIEFFLPSCRSLSSFSLPNVTQILCNPSRFERDRFSGPRLWEQLCWRTSCWWFRTFRIEVSRLSSAKRKKSRNCTQ